MARAGKDYATTGTETARRWWARGAVAAWLAAVVVLVASEGAIGFTLLVVGVVGAAAVLAGGYWFLAERGPRRWIGLAVVLAAVATVVVTFLRQDVIIVALVAVALLLLGGAAAHRALRTAADDWMPTSSTPPPRAPFIVMNPRSGGGKVLRFDLKRKAEELGAQVVLIEGPGQVDVAAIVRDAVTRGADLLGVAGGDGTQALVAASRRSTICRFWSSARVLAITSHWISAWIVTIPQRAFAPFRTARR